MPTPLESTDREDIHCWQMVLLDSVVLGSLAWSWDPLSPDIALFEYIFKARYLWTAKIE